jgi:hypothetical protein
MTRFRPNLRDCPDKTPTKLSDNIASRLPIDHGTTVLDLVYHAAELIRSLEKRASEAEDQAQTEVQQAIQDISDAKRRVDFAEEQRKAAVAALEEANSRIQRTEEALGCAESLLAAKEVQLSTAERNAIGAEELARKAETALARTEEAIRLHLLGPKRVASRVYAVAA